MERIAGVDSGRDPRWNAVQVVALLVFVGGFAWLAIAPSALHHALSLALHGDRRGLGHQLRASRGEAAALIIALALVHTVLPFPAELLELVAGFAVGGWLGAAVVEAGLLGSAIIAYGVGSRLGRPIVARLIGSDRLDRLQRRVGSLSTPGLLAVRLIPVLPFSPVSFACGVAAVRFRTYLWTTALGTLPEVILVTRAGAALGPDSRPPFMTWVLAGAVLAVLLVASVAVRRRGRGVRTSEAGVAADECAGGPS